MRLFINNIFDIQVLSKDIKRAIVDSKDDIVGLIEKKYQKDTN